MTTRNKRIVWQVDETYHGAFNGNRDFSVLLDRQFAREMFEVNLGAERQRKFNRQAQEMLEKLKYLRAEPYIFDGNSALVREFHAGRNGVWIALDGQFGRPINFSFQQPLIYSSHNCDNSADFFALTSLISYWVSYNEVLKEIGGK